MARTASILGRASAGVKVPKRRDWYFRVLNSLRDQLISESKVRRKELAQPIEPHGEDEADAANEEFDHEMAMSELAAETDALFEIEAAIERIANGTYGFCEESGNPIPVARLKAVPWTRFTKDVEARLEKQGLLSKARRGTLISVRGPNTFSPPDEDASAGPKTPSSDDDPL